MRRWLWRLTRCGAQHPRIHFLHCDRFRIHRGDHRDETWGATGESWFWDGAYEAPPRGPR